MILTLSDSSATGGGVILIIILLIITAAVFALKFTLDIALTKKLSSHRNENDDNNFFYAIKNETPRKRTTRKAPKYTIIPENKLFILENPSFKDKYR